MNWSQFVRHNRWQKLVAFLLAILIWATVARKIRQGGAVRLTLDGSSRVFEGIPVRLLAPPGVSTRKVPVMIAASRSRSPTAPK